VEESTRRIAFFGTPFKGSVKAKWGDVVRKVFGLWHETNHELLHDVQEDCSKLANLRDAFPEWLLQRKGDEETKVEIICYAEEKSTGSAGKVRKAPGRSSLNAAKLSQDRAGRLSSHSRLWIRDHQRQPHRNVQIF